MSFLIDQKYQPIHPEPDHLVKIITTQLSVLAAQGLIKPQFSRYNQFKASLQILEFSPMIQSPFDRVDFHWRFQFYKEHLKIVVSVSQSRSGVNFFLLNSQTAKVDICRIIKKINQSNCQSRAATGLSKDGSFLTFINKKWHQQNPFHPSFRKKLAEDIKQVKNLMTKTIIRCQYHFSLPKKAILKLGKIQENYKLVKQNTLNNLKIIKKSFDLFRQYRHKSSKLENFEQVFNEDSSIMKNYYLMFCQSFSQISNRQYQEKEKMINNLQSELQYSTHSSSHISKQTISKKGEQLNCSRQGNVSPIQIIYRKGDQVALETLGQHSTLTKAVYHIRILFSISQQTIKSYKQLRQANKNTQILKNKTHSLSQFDKQLIRKRSNQTNCSKNSLKNQIDFLIFIRGNPCTSIAKYYFPRKKDQTDIYIQPYPLSLSQALKFPLSIDKKLIIIHKLVQGTLFLYDQGILHRDLKPGNILLQYQKQGDLKSGIGAKICPKIIDFGSCCPIYGKQHAFEVHDMRLLSTEKYHISFNQLEIKQIKENFISQQYNRHPFFDIYAIGQIIKDLFDKQLKEYQNQAGSDCLLTFIFYTVQRCKAENPDDRLSHEQLLLLLQNMINYTRQSTPYKKIVDQKQYQGENQLSKTNAENNQYEFLNRGHLKKSSQCLLTEGKTLNKKDQSKRRKSKQTIKKMCLFYQTEKL